MAHCFFASLKVRFFTDSKIILFAHLHSTCVTINYPDFCHFHKISYTVPEHLGRRQKIRKKALTQTGFSCFTIMSYRRKINYSKTLYKTI
ncbi:hypothetical protein DN748_09175 [Sinomicrobium soli]|nr:hypothetical protein DN748_09175 [Sinomicrobium sp. N-1-3-6]